MGVPGLWDIIRPASQQRSIVHLSIHDGFLSNKHNKRGYRIGIDASIWFFHAYSSREGENPELRMLFFRLARFLALPLLPLFVFDGPKRPKYKRNKRIMTARHPLTGSFKTMIEAFGFEHHQAPGEAEAELAYLNRIEVIDAVLSDDVDNFLFGATLVMRNPSATLSGNKAHVMKNADGRQDDKQVLLFSSQRISEHPGIRLTHGGFILIGLMSGGDYDTGGLFGCGIKVSHGLAKAGFGDSLIKAYTDTPPLALPTAMSAWRASLCQYLATDPDNLIGRKNKSLASKIPASFPSLDILEAYLRPVTSESTGDVPDFAWAKQPSLKEIANRCELHYEWGVKPLIIKRFRTVIWGGALMRVLRAAVMEGDEKEARISRMMQRGIPFTPKNGRRTADIAVGTPSKLITRCLSRLDLESPQRFRVVNPFSSDYDPPAEDEPLLVKIHSQRTHASTDGVLEYRLEIAPAQFVRMTEEGLLNLRSEDSIDVANFGKRRALLTEDEGFGDGDDDGEGGKKGKEATKPNDHMRIWVPACMLEMVQPSLIEAFENVAAEKEQKKQDKEQRARDKAEGKMVPKRSRIVGSGSPSKSKATKMSLLAATMDDQPEGSAPSQTGKRKKQASKKFISDSSSDEEMGPTMPVKTTSRVGPLDLLSRNAGDSLSETEYISTGSITEQRRGKAAGSMLSLKLPAPSTKQPSSSRITNPPSLRLPPMPKDPKGSQPGASRRFMFTMKPDVLSDEPDTPDDNDLDPYAALVGINASPTRSRRGLDGQGIKGGGKEVQRSGEELYMDFDEESPVHKRISRTGESMEDFSHLFTPFQRTNPPPGDRNAAQDVGPNPVPAKKRNKFVSASDSSDEASPVQASPKKLKAHRPPRPPQTHLGSSKASPIQPKVKKPSASFPRPGDEVGGPKRKEVILEISDSSEDEELVLRKPSKTTASQPLVFPEKTRTTGRRTQSRKGKQDVSIIELDD